MTLFPQICCKAIQTYKKTSVIVLITVFFSGFTAHAENFIFNSGFELEDAGYQCDKYLLPSKNPLMKYEGPKIDRSTSVSGKNSMLLSSKYSEQMRLWVPPEMQFKPDTEYTVSLWMKSNKSNCHVTVSFISASWWGKESEYPIITSYPKISKLIKHGLVIILLLKLPVLRGLIIIITCELNYVMKSVLLLLIYGWITFK